MLNYLVFISVILGVFYVSYVTVKSLSNNKRKEQKRIIKYSNSFVEAKYLKKLFW